jgi:hypothetical protein
MTGWSPSMRGTTMAVSTPVQAVPKVSLNSLKGRSSWDMSLPKCIAVLLRS